MRMRRCILLLLFLVPTALGAESAAEAPFLDDFVVGRYHLIGQRTEGGSAYHGQIEIVRKGHDLTVTRIIEGRTLRGSATIEAAPMAETQVLRMRWEAGAEALESTCLIQGDLDNHARLTCHCYRQDGATRRPGLEALFHIE